MKYNITHICGHEEVIQLFGPMSDRKKKVEYHESCLCPDCLARERQAKSEANGYVDLVGSPKQITWALGIRDEFVWYVDKQISQRQHYGTPEAEDAMRKYEMVKQYVLHNVTSAKYWIDNRNIKSRIVRDYLQAALDANNDNDMDK